MTPSELINIEDRIAHRVVDLLKSGLEKEHQSLLRGQAELLKKPSLTPKEVADYHIEGKITKRQVLKRCSDGYYGPYARKDAKNRWEISIRYFKQKRAVERKRDLSNI